jgi:hypothetical protein
VRSDPAPAQREAAIDQLSNGLAQRRARQVEPFGQSDLVFAHVYGHRGSVFVFMYMTLRNDVRTKS